MKFLKLIEKFYRTQAFIDIGWGELDWWDSAIIKLMAYLYVFEKLGIIIVGMTIIYILIIAFIFFYILGKTLKKFGIYDKSMYVVADIDPVEKDKLRAARIIIELFGDKIKKGKGK